MRNVERMLRRAELPFRSTQGFNPHPHMSFALAMPLGVIGCEEVLEVEMEQPLPADEIRARLGRQCPPGLTLLSVRRIDPKAGPGARLGYRCRVPASRCQAIERQIAVALALSEWWVERKKPVPRRVNIRPFLSEVTLTPSETPRWEGEAPAEPSGILKKTTSVHSQETLARSEGGSFPSLTLQPSVDVFTAPSGSGSAGVLPSQHEEQLLEMLLWLRLKEQPGRRKCSSYWASATCYPRAWSWNGRVWNYTMNRNS